MKLSHCSRSRERGRNLGSVGATMNTIPQTSGIYKWTCMPTGKIYIGSAIDLYQRWQDHRWMLRTQRHANRYMQRAWNKYGEDAFVFDVLELVLSPFLLEREQYYLDKWKPFERDRGFNIYIKAGSPYGRKVSDESRRKMSESQKRRAAAMSPEQKAVFYSNRSASRKPGCKRKHPSAETRLKISLALKARPARLAED
jgi:group I intron endonuclease